MIVCLLQIFRNEVYGYSERETRFPFVRMSLIHMICKSEIMWLFIISHLISLVMLSFAAREHYLALVRIDVCHMKGAGKTIPDSLPKPMTDEEE